MAETNGSLRGRSARFLNDFGVFLLFLVLCAIAYLSYQNNKILNARNGIFNELKSNQADIQKLVDERCGR